MFVPILLAFLAMFLFWWIVPVLQTGKFKKLKGNHTSEDQEDVSLASIENEYRKTTTQLVVGLAVLAAAGVTFYQSESKRSDDTLLQGLKWLQNGSPLERLVGVTTVKDWAKAHPDRSSFVPALLVNFVNEHAIKVKNVQSDCSSNNLNRWDEYKNGNAGPSIGPDIQAALDYLRAEPVPKNISVKFDGLELIDADLSRLNAKHVSFAHSNLAGARLNSAIFESADFYCANLYGAHLPNLSVRGVKWKCDADKRPLIFTSFMGVLADKADFQDARLDNANFFDANLKYSTFYPETAKDACFAKVDFDGFDIRNLKNYDTQDFTEACVPSFEGLPPSDIKKFKLNLINGVDADHRPPWCK
jgi:hypothetical protein